MQACEAMASLAATGLEKVRVLEHLRSAADIDLVTGVHNHRYLQERLRQEVARSARSHSPLAVLMLDLDRFKPINDRHGHAEGDRVLRNVAAAITAQVRTSDVVARYGGDEFVVLMPDAPVDQAERVARRVVRGILKSRHELSDGSTVAVGVSAGLAAYPADGRTSAQLLAGGGRGDVRAPRAPEASRSSALPAQRAASACQRRPSVEAGPTPSLTPQPEAQISVVPVSVSNRWILSSGHEEVQHVARPDAVRGTDDGHQIVIADTHVEQLLVAQELDHVALARGLLRPGPGRRRR